MWSQDKYVGKVTGQFPTVQGYFSSLSLQVVRS